jgi:hypothetical protein
MAHPPYTDEEAAEARTWVCKYGPPNSWTAGNGTAARMIGRLLKERERLLRPQWTRLADCRPAQYATVLVSRGGKVCAAEYREPVTDECPPLPWWVTFDRTGPLRGWTQCEDADGEDRWMPMPTLWEPAQ